MSSGVRFSVVIPCYDEGELLRDAVQSAYRQDAEVVGPPSYEVLVIPDSGADAATEAVVSDLAESRPGLRVMRNRRAPGPSGARNTGIEAAEGEWITFLDADDLWRPNAMSTRLRVLSESPDAQWIATDFVRTWPSSNRDPVRFTESSPVARRLVQEALETGEAVRLETPVAEFNQAVLCHTNTVTVRRTLLEEVGAFSEKIKRCQDIHLWFRLAAVADLVFAPDVTALYRLRQSSVENRGHSPWGWDIRAARDLLRDPSLSPWRRQLAKGRLRWVLNNQTEFHREQEEFLAGAATALESIRHWPWQKRAWKDLLACLVRRS